MRDTETYHARHAHSQTMHSHLDVLDTFVYETLCVSSVFISRISVSES